MRRLWNTFLKGLAAVLPLALTVYVVFWLAKTAESVLGGPLRAWLPEDRYWPGLGLLVAFILILIMGVLVDAYVVRRLFRYGESILARIPIVKTIFGAFKDFSRFLPAGGNRRISFYYDQGHGWGHCYEYWIFDLWRAHVHCRYSNL